MSHFLFKQRFTNNVATCYFYVCHFMPNISLYPLLLSGTSHMALLFYLGLTMGIVSTIFANKQEVEKMKSLLKQTENLVQDLQEELEMKDSFTVKELGADDYGSKDVLNDRCNHDTVHSLSLEEKFAEEYCHEKVEEKSLNDIEAELKAELQRLESSINSSSLEGKLCNLTGVNTYFCF